MQREYYSAFSAGAALSNMADIEKLALRHAGPELTEALWAGAGAAAVAAAAAGGPGGVDAPIPEHAVHDEEAGGKAGGGTRTRAQRQQVVGCDLGAGRLMLRVSSVL